MLKIAERIATIPPELVQLNKRIVHRQMEAMGLRTGIRAGTELCALGTHTQAMRRLRRGRSQENGLTGALQRARRAVRRLPHRREWGERRGRGQRFGRRGHGRRLREHAVTAASGSLSPLDDFPVHQIAEPIRRVATTDRNFYDRYYFNMHALDRRAVLVAGLGQYPNLGVADAFVAVAPRGEHHVVRASKRARDRIGHPVGPFAVEVLEGLQAAAGRVEPNEWGIELRPDVGGRIPAHEEPRHFLRRHGRVVFDTCRLAQTGRWSGTLDVGGEHFDVDTRAVVGTPRPLVGRAAGRRAGAPGHPGHAADEHVLELCPDPVRRLTRSSTWRTRTATGERELEESVRDLARPVAAGRAPRHAPARARVRAGHSHGQTGDAVVRTGAGGEPVELDVAARLPVYLGIGSGYGQDLDWRHGMYQGPLKVQGMTFDLDDPANADKLVGLVDSVGRFEYDGHVGVGLWEYAIGGPHDKYGFESYTDGWKSSS